MTVRQKMNELMNQNSDLKDLGIFKVDKRRYGVLQNTVTGDLISVYESKDDIDDDGRPIVRSNPMNLGDFLSENFEKLD